MGALKEERYYTFEEFEEINQNSEDLLEYIDGKIYSLASPSTHHQEISVQLTIDFGLYFKRKECKVYHAPFDVKLTKEGLEPRLVIPDLAVICDKSGLNSKRYEGVPTLIVEILSPGNRKHDLLVKMNLYAEFGVKEYWVIDPIDKTVMVLELNDSGHYVINLIKSTGIIESIIFNGLTVDLDDLFDF